MGLLPQRNVVPIFFLFLFFAGSDSPNRPFHDSVDRSRDLISALMIAWAAESAQFFMAQGFALAILAWMQTLPEFAVEAVFAWQQQVPLLLANLTGALRLLTGFGWPVIYFTAADFPSPAQPASRSARSVSTSIIPWKWSGCWCRCCISR